MTRAATYSELKRTFADLDPREDPDATPRTRSELFPRRRCGPRHSLAALGVRDRPSPEGRQLTFLAMGGAYRRVARRRHGVRPPGALFSLEHLGPRSTAWVDRSWEVAHADGSGGVYTNFPDPDLIDWPRAYHGGNHRRLARIKRAYDPDRLFDFPQCIEPDTEEDS